MSFFLLTLTPLDHKMDVTIQRAIGKRPSHEGAEGASLDLAKPDETLRQKDPILESTLENSARNTDGVNLVH